MLNASRMELHSPAAYAEPAASVPNSWLESLDDHKPTDLISLPDQGRRAVQGGSTTQRLLDVLELLIEHPTGIGLSDVSRVQSLSKGATHRLLATLTEAGFVEQPPGRDIYRLTLKLATLGFRHVRHLGLLEICQPVLDQLAEATGELVRMTLADNRGLTWVARAQGARFGLRYDPDMGSPVVLHATASGRAWLADLPRREARRLVEATGFAVPERFGLQKIHSFEELDVELDRTGARGFGLAVDEGEPGASAIAMTIPTNPGDRVGATISVAGPTVRMTPERIEEIAPRLREATVELSELWPILSMKAS